MRITLKSYWCISSRNRRNTLCRDAIFCVSSHFKDAKYCVFTRVFTCLYIVGFLFGFQTNAQTIKTSVETTHILIGEQFLYQIDVDTVAQVVFPDFEGLENLELISELNEVKINNHLIKKYVFTGFDSGSFTIPPQKLLIDTISFYTDSVLINVSTVVVDTTKQKLFPIKGIAKEPYVYDDFKPYFWWVVLGLILLGIVGYLIFRKKKPRDKLILEVQILPYQQALERL